MEQEQYPLEMIFQEIEKALEAKLYYVAIAVSLSVPDICSLLEDEPGKVWSKEEKYVAWCEKNLAKKSAFLSPVDIWRLRGGVLHQGSLFGHPKSRFNTVLFTIPNAQKNVFHNNLMKIGGKVALNLDTPTFCHDIISAAREWYAKNKDNPNIRANIENLVRLRPHGLSPYIVGAPLIA